MVTEEDILDAARLIRQRYEDCIEGFPFGHCIDAAYDLHNELAKLGIASNVINGEWIGPVGKLKSLPNWGRTHTWVTIPSFNMIIDVTADQFDDSIPPIHMESAPFGKGGKNYKYRGMSSQVTPQEAKRLKGIGIPTYVQHEALTKNRKPVFRRRPEVRVRAHRRRA